MKKKLILMVLTLTCFISLVGCSTKNNSNKDNSNTSEIINSINYQYKGLNDEEIENLINSIKVINKALVKTPMANNQKLMSLCFQNNSDLDIASIEYDYIIDEEIRKFIYQNELPSGETSLPVGEVAPISNNLDDMELTFIKLGLSDTNDTLTYVEYDVANDSYKVWNTADDSY